MSLDINAITRVLKDIKKVLGKSAKFLQNSGEQMQKFGKSLKNAENDIGKIITSSGDITLTTPTDIQQIDGAKKVKIGTPKRIEPLKLHPPPEVKKSKSEIQNEVKLESSQEKTSLINIKNQISKLLDNLKHEVLLVSDSDETFVENSVVPEKSNLDTFKAKMSKLYGRFRKIIKEDEFYDMTPEQRSKALKDMEDAIKILNKEYNNN